jgi:hypothetical protein
MTTPKFHTYPKKWGMQLHYTGNPLPLNGEDLAMLKRLRELFEDRQGDILSWKFDLAPLCIDFPGITFVLKRLWANGIITKFSSQFHTVHGNAEYIKWLIWEGDTDDKVDRRDTGTPGYIV